MRFLTVLPLLCLAACSTTTETLSTETVNLPTTITDRTPTVTPGGVQGTSSEDRLYRSQTTRLRTLIDADLRNKSNSGSRVIPNQGGADFEGILSVQTLSGRDAYIAIANIDIVADFKDQTLASETEQFTLFDRSTGSARVVGPMTGSIDLTNGKIGETRHNSVDFDINGTVTHPDATITVFGDLSGSIKGNPQIKGIYANEGQGGAIVNGGVTQVGIVLDAVAK